MVDNLDDRVEVARRCVETNPNNKEAWNMLIADSRNKPIEECRQFYEQLVRHFSTNGMYWKFYIDKLMVARDYEGVEEVFNRCLKNILHVGLWTTYLNYIKETKYPTPSYRESMAKAYDFAISKIGLDYFSFPIWNDYITFLTSVQTMKMSSEGLRIQMIRKIFHKGVTTPMENIDLLWNDYCHFEQVHSQAISKRQIEDKRQEYCTARDVASKINIFISQIDNSSGESLFKIWKEYIGYEKSNPMNISDMALFTDRLIFVYNKALLSLGHNLEIMIDETVFLEQIRVHVVRQGDVNLIDRLTSEISRIYEQANDDSLLLHLSHAKFAESCMNYFKVHSIYRNLLAKREFVDLIYIHYMRFIRRVEGLTAVRTLFVEACNNPLTTYRIYVAFAYMEYYCNKNKHVPIKIFSLALDRFGEECRELVNEYLEFVLSLNDDGIIQTAFARYFPNDKILIEKYANFESHVGDLAAINKVESHRLSLYDDGDILTRIAERYSIMDMCPFHKCDVSADVNLINEKQPIVVVQPVRPDTSQMLVYKPRSGFINTSFHPIIGGQYPPIASLDYLNSSLPPPNLFTGPFVNVDRLIEVVVSLPLIDTKNNVMSGIDQLKNADPGCTAYLDSRVETTKDTYVDIYSSRHLK